MLACIFRRSKGSSSELLSSQLYDEQTFYHAFMRDLSLCKNEAIVESPFLTTRRVAMTLPTLQKLVARGVRVMVNTRHPNEHDEYLRSEAEGGIAMLQNLGVEVLYTGGHHRKLAILDRQVLYEGSLNILSQNDSCEVMRRINSSKAAQDMLNFIKINQFLI